MTPLRTGLLLAAVLLGGCFAPPFPEAPVTGPGHGGHGRAAAAEVGAVGTVDHPGHAPLVASQGLSIEPVCFQVSGPPGEGPQRIAGAVYHDGTLDDARAALVLIPGGSEIMHVWDGDVPALGVANASTLPRRLALAGYAVFVYDRLGMGESPYAGDAHSLAPALTATHAGEIVAHLRAATYALPRGDACERESESAPAFATVVLGGHSYGAIIALVRAGDAQDVDGLLLLNYVPGGGNPEFFDRLNECLASQLLLDPLVQYIYPFCPGEDGWSQHLCWVTTYAPASTEEVMRSYCANEELHLEPIGSLGDFAYVVPASALPRPVGDIPVHFVTADHDCPLNTGPDCADTSAVDAGLERFALTCGCRASSLRLENMGHMHVSHLEQWRVGDDVLAWMEAEFP